MDPKIKSEWYNLAVDLGCLALLAVVVVTLASIFVGCNSAPPAPTHRHVRIDVVTPRKRVEIDVVVPVPKPQPKPQPRYYPVVPSNPIEPRRPRNNVPLPTPRIDYTPPPLHPLYPLLRP